MKIDVSLTELRRNSVTRALLAAGLVVGAGVLSALEGEGPAEPALRLSVERAFDCVLRAFDAEKSPEGSPEAQVARGQVVSGTGGAGGYELMARDAHGREVTLTSQDLVRLDPDISNSTLSGDGTVYSAVPVRPQATSFPAAPVTVPAAIAAPAKPDTKKPPFNAREAKGLLAAKKRAGNWASPPTEDESRAFLLAIYNGVPNDLHRGIRRQLWPDQIKRGPRPKRPTAE